MQGFAYLKEAGAGFIVQLIPLKINWHQWDTMVALAQSLSAHYRVGAPWLYLSSCGSPERNREIAAQRLSPAQVIELDRPNPGYGERMAELNPEPACGTILPGDNRLFARCIEGRRDFHIDPYGQMSWCSFIKDPALRSQRTEFRDTCRKCALVNLCLWCPAHAHLETGLLDGATPNLCEVAHQRAASIGKTGRNQG